MSKSEDENTEEKVVLYDKDALADMLSDLRNKDGKNKLSLEELSKDIKKETGVEISTTQLNKYEKADKVHMNLNNLFALAKYYKVSIYNLLGMNECKDADNEEIHKRLGLDETAIKSFETLSSNDILKATINFMLGTPIFWKFVTSIAYHRYSTPVIMTLLQYSDELDEARFKLAEKIKKAKNAGDIELANKLRKRAKEIGGILTYYVPDKKAKMPLEKIEKISLFEISELAIELAKEYLNQNKEVEKDG